MCLYEDIAGANIPTVQPTVVEVTVDPMVLDTSNNNDCDCDQNNCVEMVDPNTNKIVFDCSIKTEPDNTLINHPAVNPIANDNLGIKQDPSANVMGKPKYNDIITF